MARLAKLLLVLMLLVATAQLRAQENTEAPADSSLFSEQLKKNVLRFFFSFDNNIAIGADSLYRFNGIKIGLDRNHQWRFGLEFRTLVNPLVFPGETRIPGATSRELSFTSLSLFGEYILYRDFKWEVSFPASIGLGTGTYNHFSANRQVAFREEVDGLPLYSAAATGHYKLFPWFGIGTGLGYRQVVSSDQELRRGISRPFYVVKVKLFLGDLYRSIYEPATIRAQREAWEQQRAARRKRRAGE